MVFLFVLFLSQGYIDYKLSKILLNSNIVKYHYNLKQLFSILIFIIDILLTFVMAKLNL